MDNNAGMTAVGVGMLGFGILLIFSAYAKVPLFGKGGLVTGLLQNADMEAAGKAAGEGIRKAAEAAKKAQGQQKPASVSPGGNGGAVQV